MKSAPESNIPGNRDFSGLPPEERQGFVNGVFRTVAGRYDLMNDLMSGGLHRLWKDELVSLLDPPRDTRPFRLLDIAGGTGDVAVRAMRQAGSGASAVICDLSPEMIEEGRRKIAAMGFLERISLVEGNAEALPFEDRSFDAVTIAFGIRNVPRLEKALSESYRTLKYGGRFLCLEFSAVGIPVLDRLYDFHSFEVIPRLGRLVAGAEEPYRYLVESIRRFPRQEAFAEKIREAGFSCVSFRNLTGGIAAIHSGWRI